jgi:leucyl aminopeptidase
MITIELVNPTTLGDVKLSSFDKKQIESQDFTGKSGQQINLINNTGEVHHILFGLEDGDSLWSVANITQSLSPGTYQIKTDKTGEALFLIHLVWYLSLYRFDRYKTQYPHKLHLIDSEQIDSKKLQLLKRSIYWLRDLVNTPAEDMGPAQMQLSIEQLAKTCGATVNVIVGTDCISEGFPLTHAVGRASDREPRVVELQWGKVGNKKVTLVGKGVCFDTGGLDLKTAAGMRLMKKDMSGAAHALALGNLIMGMELPIDLRVIVPIVDNNLGSRSYRPGDIFISRNGKSIEIGNTDAEGRLILADALTAACERSPDLLIDFATLTGNRALGSVVSCFSKDVELTREVQAHGVTVDDPVWSMPIIDDYVDLFKSDIADLVNIANTPMDAGTVTAAAFLSEFVTEGTTWVHCDLLGYNPRKTPGKPKGAEAMGIRAWFSFLEAWVSTK